MLSECMSLPTSVMHEYFDIVVLYRVIYFDIVIVMTIVSTKEAGLLPRTGDVNYNALVKQIAIKSRFLLFKYQRKIVIMQNSKHMNMHVVINMILTPQLVQTPAVSDDVVNSIKSLRSIIKAPVIFKHGVE